MEGAVEILKCIPQTKPVCKLSRPRHKTLKRNTSEGTSRLLKLWGPAPHAGCMEFRLAGATVAQRTGTHRLGAKGGRERRLNRQVRTFFF